MKYVAAALLASLLPLTVSGAPIISPEIGMDQPVFGPAWKDQTSPAVAHDNSGGYLVVWTDNRRAPSPSADIYATRIDSAGKVLDRGGILVSSSPGTIGSPAVTHNGKNFFVVWHGASGGKHGAHVSPAGVVLDRPALKLSTTMQGSTRTDVAYSKGAYLLVWQEHASAYSIVGALVDSGGKLLQKITIHGDSSQRRNPRVAATDDGTFLVVWQDYRSGQDNHTYGALVTVGGDVKKLTISTTADGEYLPSVAYGGGNFLVVWHTNSDIRGVRLSPKGQLLDSKGLDICLNKNIRMAPSLAYGGGKTQSFLVVWKDFRDSTDGDLFGTRVSAAGKVLQTKGFAVSDAAGLQDTPAVGGGAAGFFVAWADHRDKLEANIYGARVDPAGKVLDKTGTLLSSAANHQSAPDVAHGGEGFLVVWQDRRGGVAPGYRADIRGARLAPPGAVQDAKGVALFSSPRDELEPAVAHHGNHYMVVWRDRSPADGKELLLGAGVWPATLSKVQTLVGGLSQKFAPTLARGTATMLLGWYTPTLGAVTLARLDSGGKVVGGEIAAGFGQSPAMAHGDGSFLVVWSVDENCPGRPVGTSCILGVRVSPDGKLLGAGKPAPLSSTKERRYADPAVAFDGANFLVVWADNRNGASLHDPATDIYGVRVDPKGKPLGSLDTAICTATGVQQKPAVAHDGADFVVAWMDSRNGDLEDLYGGRIGSLGQVRDPGGIALSRASTREQDPRLASDGAGHTLLVYSRYDDSASFGAQRVRGRMISWHKLANGFPCTLNVHCVSNHCVDGVCCDQACGGGSLLDCLACSVALGAATDGTCGPVKAAQICRKAAAWDVCDVAERCDGAALTCPPDIKRGDGYPCSGGTCQKGLCVSLPDAGAPDGASTPPAGRGCSCEATPGPAPWAAGLLLLLALVLARRPAPWR